MAPQKHAAVADLHHDGLKDGSARSHCAKILDSKIVECSILLLVFVDIGLLSIEAGIDHHLLCIEGEVVPRPAGLPAQHHFLLQRAWGPLGWPIAPMSDAGVDRGSQALFNSSSGIGVVDQSLHETEKASSDVHPQSSPLRIKSTVLHVKHKHSAGRAPVSDDPDGLDVIKKIHSSDSDRSEDEKHLKKRKHEHHGHKPKEVFHHKHAAHHKGKAHSEHAETSASHSEHETHGHSELGAHGNGPKEVLMCETRHGHHAHHIAHSCHLASIYILCIFLAEITLKFWVNPSGFCHNHFLVLDATVIIVSLVTDTLIMWWVQTHSPEQVKELAMIAGALLFVRCWRVVRIAHGLAEHVHHAHHEHVEHEELTKRSSELEEELRTTREELRSARGY